MKLLCDGSTKDNTWGIGVSSACGREHWDIGGLASDIPILQEENGHIDVSVAETLCTFLTNNWILAWSRRKNVGDRERQDDHADQLYQADASS